MQSVMILKGAEPTWPEAKRQLGQDKKKLKIIKKRNS